MSDKPSDKQKETPRRSAAGDRVATEREARLAVALRANLRRRKAQSRVVRSRERALEPPPDDPNT